MKIPTLMTWLLIPVMALAFWISAVTWDVPLLEDGSWSEAGEQAWAGAHNRPTWTHAIASEFPDCKAASATFGDRVAVTLDATVHRMSFDEAWRRSHNANKADDVWVVGVCPR